MKRTSNSSSSSSSNSSSSSSSSRTRRKTQKGARAVDTIRNTMTMSPRWRRRRWATSTSLLYYGVCLMVYILQNDSVQGVRAQASLDEERILQDGQHLPQTSNAETDKEEEPNLQVQDRSSEPEQEEHEEEESQHPPLPPLLLPPLLPPPTEQDEEQPHAFQHEDPIEDSFWDPLSDDPSCRDEDCFRPPKSTIETEVRVDATCFKGGAGDDDATVNSDSTQKQEQQQQQQEQQCTPEERIVDKHWGNDPDVLAMRDQLRSQAQRPLTDSRPPIFLMPGLASTRLVAWRLKTCTGMFANDIKVQDNVWLNIHLVLQMGTINVDCMKECLRLGLNQSDDLVNNGCKLRPDEGLDAIASLAPGGIGSSLLVGGTNTVYSWLIQWLADNLGYDVTNILGLPYDWRLSPDKMEERDGFLSMTRRRIEAAVASNGQPGIMVAHSMGNLVFRYFLEWLRVQMRDEAYQEYVTRARRRAQSLQRAKSEQQQQQQQQHSSQTKAKSQLPQQHRSSNPNKAAHPPKPLPTASTPTAEEESSFLPGWMTGVVSGLDDWYEWLTSQEEQQQQQQQQQQQLLDAVNDDGGDPEVDNNDNNDEEKALNAQLWELAMAEGDAKWLEWLEAHIWAYAGLSAPMLGAVNPLRAVISGENMGLPINDDIARDMEVTFGSTHTLNPVSIATGFCDDWDTDDWGSEPPNQRSGLHHQTNGGDSSDDPKLACLDDIMNDIELSSGTRDPWTNFPALKALLRDRIDWDTIKPMIDIKIEECMSNKSTNNKRVCKDKDHIKLGARDMENGDVFNIFNSLWKEEGEPLITKREQLEESFINTNVANMLNHTWERPIIKHVIMAYGVDIPTEVGYIYKKTIDLDEEKKAPSSTDQNKTDGLPDLKAVLWEGPNGKITVEPIEASRGSLAEHFIKKKPKREPFEESPKGSLAHGGDGSVPYLSLSWVHTWLLHAARARRFKEDRSQILGEDRKNALDFISISHRPHGDIDWVNGPPPKEIAALDPSMLVDTADTGVDHPHGTRYKPLMTRYHNVGVSRTTGIEYTTTVIEALGVEHKETTRNYDILAAVFTDVLKYMHDDLGLVGENTEKN